MITTTLVFIGCLFIFYLARKRMKEYEIERGEIEEQARKYYDNGC